MLKEDHKDEKEHGPWDQCFIYVAVPAKQEEKKDTALIYFFS
jgi:hypothetical protein